MALRGFRPRLDVASPKPSNPKPLDHKPANPIADKLTNWPRFVCANIVHALMHKHIYIYMYTHVYIYMYVDPWRYLGYVCMCVCKYVCPSLCPSLSLPLSLSLSLATRQTISSTNLLHCDRQNHSHCDNVFHHMDWHDAKTRQVGCTGPAANSRHDRTR